MRGQSCDGGGQVRERKHLMAILAQEVGDHLNHGQLVVNKKHFGHNLVIVL